jgi:hypothetical protein
MGQSGARERQRLFDRGEALGAFDRQVEPGLIAVEIVHRGGASREGLQRERDDAPLPRDLFRRQARLIAAAAKERLFRRLL